MFAQNKFLIRFYNKLFLSILTSFPPWPIMPFLYDVWNVKLQQWAKGLVWSRGGKHFSKTFSIIYMLNSKNRVFNPYFWIGACPMRIILLRIIREFNLLSFWWKNNRFLWNFCLAIFMGNPSLRLSEVLCLPGVSWWLSGSSSWCHGVVCGLWLWYFLIIITIFIFKNAQRWLREAWTIYKTPY